MGGDVAGGQVGHVVAVEALYQQSGGGPAGDGEDVAVTKVVSADGNSSVVAGDAQPVAVAPVTVTDR